jgi:phosphomannomutase
MGTDISHIFKAYDVRGKVGSELTAELAKAVGRAFADYLPVEGPVAVGRDMRPDSAELADSLIQGLLAQGREVYDLGQITSDMSYFAVGKYDLAGAAMITASHNPGEYNGIKFYRDQVIAVGLDSGLDVIRDAVLGGTFKPEAATPGTVTSKNIIEDWVTHALSFTGGELPAYHIAIDAGNGMAGAILPFVEDRLPLTVERLFYELDGTFPNHEANPMKPENMQDLIKAVNDGGLDLGIAFDGDGDRAGFVDDKGRIVSGSDIISLVAKMYLEKYPGSEIVHEVRTSRATKELIKEWGGKPYRTKAGRVSIGSVMRERGAAFGGETTGHLFFKENYYADSGLIAALVSLAAIAESGKKLSELVDEYHRYESMPEMNFEVHDKDGALEKIAEAFTGPDYTQDHLDGLTVEATDFWFNLRASNT